MRPYLSEPPTLPMLAANEVDDDGDDWVWVCLQERALGAYILSETDSVIRR